MYDWIDIPWLKSYYNFGFDHFNMSRKKTGVRGLVDLLLGNAGPFAASGDWILPDLSIQRSMKLNANLQTFPNTFYFSYATKRTTKPLGMMTVPSGVMGIHPLLFIRVLQMSQWQFPRDIPLPYKGYRSDSLNFVSPLKATPYSILISVQIGYYRDQDWQDNDGALNTISMTHPRIPVEHSSLILRSDSDCLPLLPGIWLVLFSL